jgi:hypothetical protein
MLRAQAIAVLKELATKGLIDTAWVSIEEKTPSNFQLKVKGGCDRALVEPFLQKYNLTLEENKEKSWIVIY